MSNIRLETKPSARLSKRLDVIGKLGRELDRLVVRNAQDCDFVALAQQYDEAGLKYLPLSLREHLPASMRKIERAPTGTDLQLLVYLSSQGRSSRVEIARVLDISVDLLTPVLEGLTRRGLIRSWSGRYYITELGREVVA